MIEEPGRSDAILETWHVYDAGGPTLLLKIRYRDKVELPNWREGPDLLTALEQAERGGWHAYDREPGEAPGEYVILHMECTQGPGRP
jgi:hypothetical protein